MPSPFQRARRGGRPSAAEENRKAELLERLARSVAGAGGSMGDEGFQQFAPDDFPLIGKITGATTGTGLIPAYTWKLQDLQFADGAAAPLVVDSDFFTDDMPWPAYELSSNKNVPTDGTAIVKLYPSPAGPYLLFAYPRTFRYRYFCSGGSGSGSGSGGGATELNCCSRGTPGLPSLTGTVTNKVGIFTSLPDTLTFGDSTGMGGPWIANFTPVSCGGGNSVSAFNIACATMALTPNGSCGFYTIDPDSGASCGPPVFAVYHVNDGAGNSCVITVVE